MKFANLNVWTNSPVSKDGAGVLVDVSAKFNSGKAKKIRSQTSPGASNK